ncbi:hypothetical protein [Methanobrevibacter millerae]|nr:hypothetical protein [Methanobrevibacter millerae]
MGFKIELSYWNLTEGTENEIKRIINQTEVYELAIEHINGKITVEK